MRIKWLHLSDIHFNYKNYESHSLREDFLKRIQSLDQSEPFTHLFITGDILYGNAKADSETIMFVKDLMNIMGLTKESVYIVPGNHDHDRIITQGVLKKLYEDKNEEEYTSVIDNLTELDISKLLKSQLNFNDACSRIFDDTDFSWNMPHFITAKNAISVLSMNTSWLDTDSSSKEDYLRIGTRLLQMKLTENASQLNQSLNIAIGHHTLGDMIPEERNRVLDQFKRHNIGMYFCGHRHKPKIEYYNKYDVLEFVAPGGYNDSYSNGGYIWGIIDTDTDFYKAEVYGWYDNKWCIENKLDGTDEYGFYYFNTQKYVHNSSIAAVDCKTIGGHIPIRDLEKVLCCNNFDVHVYNGPCDNVNGYTADTIKDFSNNIVKLVEKNEIVHLFPLAPIPMLVALGFNLQKNSNITIHQFNRDTQSWVLNEKNDNISLLEPECAFEGNKILAVAISTSYTVEKEQIDDIFKSQKYDFVHLKTNEIAPGYPLYSNDVNNIAKEIISFLNTKVNSYNEIHLFASIPAALAVELGRNMLATVYSNIHTYQLIKGEYKKDIIINKKDEQKSNENCLFVDWLQINNVTNLLLKGRAPCGKPNIGDPENEKYFPILESILSSGEHFVVKATGDSMVGAGIEDGDYIVVKAQPVADNGQIVVALIDGEVTIKRFFRDDENKKIVLHPENDAYSDILCDNVEIQGIAVNIIKSI